MTLEEMQKLCDEATPGPWLDDYAIRLLRVADLSENMTNNMQFTIVSRELMPKLLRVAKAANAIHDQANPDYEDVIALRRALEELEKE